MVESRGRQMYVPVSTGRFCISKSALSMLYHYIYRRLHNTTHTCTCKSVSFLYNANDLSERKKAMELMYIF